MKLSTLTLLGLLSLTSPALANDCWIRAMDRADSVMDDIEDLGDELRSMSPGSSMYRQKLCLRINKFVRYTQARQRAASCKNDYSEEAKWQREERINFNEALSVGCR
jgi:hypothetical protein